MAENDGQPKPAPPPGATKKKCPTCKKGTPLWFISWADMVTLLLCLFVIIVAYSSQDKGKFQTVAGSMKDAFGGNSFDRNPRPTPRGYHVVGMQYQRHIQLANLTEQIQAALTPLLNNGQANAFEDPAGAVFQLDREVIFQPGTSTMNAATHLMLADVAAAVSNIPNTLEIRSAPAGKPDKPFDWNVGKEEAAAIATLFETQGKVPGSRIRVTALAAADKGESLGKKPTKDKIEVRVVAVVDNPIDLSD